MSYLRGTLLKEEPCCKFVLNRGIKMGFIKSTDHRSTDPPTTFNLPTDPPTGRHQLS